MKNRFLDIRQNYKKILCIFFPIFTFLLVFDLLSKHFVNQNLMLGEKAGFIPGVIELTNVHNDGAAWNIFSGSQVFLIVFTSVFLALFLLYYFTESKSGALFHVASGFIIAGCLGKLVDRIAFSYVRDMIHLQFFPTFPVFNIADCCVCVGVFLIILFYLLFFIKSAKKEKEKK